MLLPSFYKGYWLRPKGIRILAQVRQHQSQKSEASSPIFILYFLISIHMPPCHRNKMKMKDEECSVLHFQQRILNTVVLNICLGFFFIQIFQGSWYSFAKGCHCLVLSSPFVTDWSRARQKNDLTSWSSKKYSWNGHFPKGAPFWLRHSMENPQRNQAAWF